MIKLLNIDCMDYMATVLDKYFDLAIVDVPYGINVTNMKLGEGGGVYKQPKKYKRGEWDKSAPNKSYFVELMRISKNQIIWGANHFISLIPYDSPSWLVWDKNNGETSFADCELAWSSFSTPVRMFKYTWSGFIQGKMGNAKEERIHPTQKPVQLYKWLLKNYASPDFRIIDTHLGSGSSAIACHDFGVKEFVGCEIDKEYYESAKNRFETYKLQTKLCFT